MRVHESNVVKTTATRVWKAEIETGWDKRIFVAMLESSDSDEPEIVRRITLSTQAANTDITPAGARELAEALNKVSDQYELAEARMRKKPPSNEIP